MREVYVSASGGMDSSFRLCELSFQKNTEVFPIYMYSKERLSYEREWDALNYIVSFLQEQKRTKALIHDPIKVLNKELPVSFDLQQAWGRVMRDEHFYFSSQNIRVASLSRLYPGVEFCYEKYYLDHLENFRRVLFRNGAMKFDKYGVGYLDQSRTTPDLYLLFGQVHFPLITRSKFDIYNSYKKFGYDCLFPHICSCRKDFPEWCGYCVSCKEKMSQEFYPFFTKKSKKFYMLYQLMISFYHMYEENFKNFDEFIFVLESMLDDLFVKGKINDDLVKLYPDMSKTLLKFYVKSFKELNNIVTIDFKRTEKLLK